MNNFDTSTKAVDIEVYVSRNWDSAQMDFRDNFESIEDNWRHDPLIFFYTNYGQNELMSVRELLTPVYDKNTKETLIKFLVDTDHWEYYFNSKSEMQKTKKDYLHDLVTDYLADFKLEEGMDFASSHDIVIAMDDYELFSTRGYCQGDYAEVVVPKADYDSALIEYVGHLFWDAMVSCSIVLDGVDFYIDEYVKDSYEYDRDEVLAILTQSLVSTEYNEDEVTYILETVADMLPEYPRD